MSELRFGWDGRLFDVLLVLDTYLGRPRVSRWLGGMRRWNLGRLERRAARDPGPRARVADVPVRHDLDPATFARDFRRPGRPVLMKGLAKRFPAVGRWTPELFRDRYGRLEVVTVDGARRAAGDLETGRGEIHVARMTLGEQVARMLRGESDYVSFSTELFVRHPELGADLDLASLEPYLARRRLSRAPIHKPSPPPRPRAGARRA